MRRLQSVCLALLLFAFGWAAGQAQVAQPDFELVVEAPAGATTITCKRGCNLAWVERGVPQQASQTPEFSFRCGGPNVERCSSYAVGGWVVR
jgi:hypothetical protein